MLMNHCDVARKMTGLWQRQQCGYVVRQRLAMPEPRPFVERLLDLRIRVEDPETTDQLDGRS